MINYYKVGGFVRDQFLGVKSKDIDYAVEAPSYAAMIEDIEKQGGKIFVQHPEYLTARAKMGVEIADFVLCRKEGAYRDGRRPDEVEMGTIEDDLARRDFTMNAIAQRADGSYYDPHNGIADIRMGVIRCVGVAADRLKEDPLRLLRAFRFHITKGFILDPSIRFFLDDALMIVYLKTVSVERVMEEMNRCFAHDTYKTFTAFKEYPKLADQVLQLPRVSLELTLRDRT